MKYPVVFEGETVIPRRRGYRMVCCDCGLVHRFNFRLIPNGTKGGKRIAFTAYRDERATAAIRRRPQAKR